MDRIGQVLKQIGLHSRLISYCATAEMTYFAIYINVQLYRKLLSGETIPKNTRLSHGPAYLALYYSIGIVSGIFNYVADSLDEKRARRVRFIGWGTLLPVIYFGTAIIDRVVW